MTPPKTVEQYQKSTSDRWLCEKCGEKWDDYWAMENHECKPKKPYVYKLYQGWMQVAMVEAPTEKQARQEIDHYAMMYAQDGPVKIVKGKR